MTDRSAPGTEPEVAAPGPVLLMMEARAPWEYAAITLRNFLRSRGYSPSPCAMPHGCPTTSIYSKTDGIVAWKCSLNGPAAHTENIDGQASQIGMGMNPLALYAVVDRLAQNPAQWKPFDAQGARRWFFKTGAPGLSAL